MGQDKAFLEIGGEPLIKRQLKLLARIFDKFLIVTNSPQKYIGFESTKITCDVIPGMGPLGGIYSGLLSSRSFYNFVIACDMPCIDTKLVEHMITLKEGFDIVVPRTGNRYEMLFAIYSKNCIKPAYEALKKDILKVRELLSKVRVREVTGDEITRFGLADTMFMNVNTKEDLCSQTLT